MDDKPIVGRPRQYRNAADKQKAYRERQKAQRIDESHLLEFLSLLTEREQALRNGISYWQSQGRHVEIRIGRNSNFAQLEINRRFVSTTDVLVCEWLIIKGSLQLVRSQFGDNYYQLVIEAEQHG